MSKELPFLLYVDHYQNLLNVNIIVHNLISNSGKQPWVSWWLCYRCHYYFEPLVSEIEKLLEQ